MIKVFFTEKVTFEEGLKGEGVSQTHNYGSMSMTLEARIVEYFILDQTYNIHHNKIAWVYDIYHKNCLW